MAIKASQTSTGKKASNLNEEISSNTGVNHASSETQVDSAKKAGTIGVKEQKKRALAKAFTWRLIGSMDTMVIAYILMTFFGQAAGVEECKDGGSNAQIAFSIGIVEVISKSFLYYFHERMWTRIQFGLPKKEDYSI